MKIKLLILAAAAALSLITMGTLGAHATDLTVCTGAKTGKYYSTTVELSKQLRGTDTNVVAVETLGSLDNLRKLDAGECDAAIVQSDAYGVYTSSNPASKLSLERVAPLYDEYAQLVCNKNSAIHRVYDLIANPDVGVIVGPQGSGTAVTWQSWANQSPDYKKVRTLPIAGNRAISNIIDATEAQCMIFVSGLKSGTMNNVNDLGKDTLQLVPIDDNWFDDVKDSKGRQVYSFKDIIAGTYSNLNPGGFFGGGNVTTLAIGAVLVINSNWIDAHSQNFDDFSATALRWAAQQPK